MTNHAFLKKLYFFKSSSWEKELVFHQSCHGGHELVENNLQNTLSVLVYKVLFLYKNTKSRGVKALSLKMALSLKNLNFET